MAKKRKGGFSLASQAASGGGGGGKKKPADMMKQMQKIQEEMARAQENLENESVEGTAGGGIVTVTANGKGKITGVKIDPEAVDPEEIEMLEDLVLAAVNNAAEKAEELSESKMGPLTQGLNITGM